MRPIECHRTLRKQALVYDYIEKTAQYPPELLPAADQIPRQWRPKLAKDQAIQKAIDSINKNRWKESGRKNYITRG